MPFWMRPPFPQQCLPAHLDSVSLAAIGRLVLLAPRPRPNSAYKAVMKHLEGMEAVADILEQAKRPNLGAWGGGQ